MWKWIALALAVVIAPGVANAHFVYFAVATQYQPHNVDEEPQAYIATGKTRSKVERAAERKCLDSLADRDCWITATGTIHHSHPD